MTCYFHLAGSGLFLEPCPQLPDLERSPVFRVREPGIFVFQLAQRRSFGIRAGTVLTFTEGSGNFRDIEGEPSDADEGVPAGSW